MPGVYPLATYTPGTPLNDVAGVLAAIATFAGLQLRAVQPQKF